MSLDDKTKIIELTYELTRAYADAKQCRDAVRLLPTDARFQAACAAMQGMLAKGAHGESLVTQLSVKYADALLAQLAPSSEATK